MISKKYFESLQSPDNLYMVLNKEGHGITIPISKNDAKEVSKIFKNTPSVGESFYKNSIVKYSNYIKDRGGIYIYKNEPYYIHAGYILKMQRG